MNKNVIYFLGSLFTALGGVFVASTDWQLFTTPKGVAAIFMAIGSVLIGWLTYSPLDKPLGKP